MPHRPLPPNTRRHSESEKAKRVFHGVRFDIYQWEQEQFDGSKATYEIAKREDTVVVIPVIDNEIILVKEQQPHWDKEGLALVAGMVNPGEDLRAAAARELVEETGMVFTHFDLVYMEPVVPAIEWAAYTFVATGYQTTVDKKLDAGEKTEVIKMNLDEVITLARKQAFFYPPRFIEHHLIRDTIDELKEVLKKPSEYSIPF